MQSLSTDRVTELLIDDDAFTKWLEALPSVQALATARATQVISVTPVNIDNPR